MKRVIGKMWQLGITPIILMPELWVFCMTLVLLELYSCMEFHFNSISWTVVIAKWKVWRGKMWQREVTPKYWCQSYGSFAWLLSLLSSIHVWSFISIAPVEHRVISKWKVWCGKMRQSGITPKILMAELWILCMTLVLLELYSCMKFHFNSISRTRLISK